MCSSGDEEEDDAGGPGDSMFFFEAFSNAQLANKSRRGITGYASLSANYMYIC